MKLPTLLLSLMLSGCAALEPDALRIEGEHTSSGVP